MPIRKKMAVKDFMKCLAQKKWPSLGSSMHELTIINVFMLFKVFKKNDKFGIEKVKNYKQMLVELSDGFS